MPPRAFNIELIRQSLKNVQKIFRKLNSRLYINREYLSDLIIENLLLAYEFVNKLVDSGVNLLDPAGLASMLEINNIVLCGNDRQKREEFYSYIMDARKKFHNGIAPILQWLKKKKMEKTPLKTAAGYYTRALSMPQLFIEGNHRTENIVVNYLMLRQGGPVFVISPESAFEYFQLSGSIKYTNKNALGSKLVFRRYENEFKTLMKTYGSKEFLIQEQI